MGKTSAARIFSKSLNCVQGPIPRPCDACDICLSIAAGNDVDVLEIDGASNRGIDEIRQLRSNVGVRPSRSRFKVYIIDEVHMLTKEAFNALLKTLEEPPEHVKFIFCTTDPEKIPITVLSRASVSILLRWKRRRLSNVWSKSSKPKAAPPKRLPWSSWQASCRVDARQSVPLGTATVLWWLFHYRRNGPRLAGDRRRGIVAELATALLEKNAAQSLQQLDQALSRGVDVGQLAEQLLGYLRNVLAALVGVSGDLLRQAPASDLKTLKACGEQWGLETILAAVQILDQSLTRMRQSVDRRTLIEVALIRICHLADLQSLTAAIGELRSGPGPHRGKARSPACLDHISIFYAFAHTRG